MALSFNKSKGAAEKSSINAYKFEDGDNTFRIVGDICPRYVYWIKGLNGKNIPVECLEFNRDEERFDRVEKDWVKEYYPDLKCSWAYATQCITPDGKLKVLNLKKKLWEQVIVAAEDLGDPTDPDTGWDIKVKRVKTGSAAFNVEYQLQALKCKPRPLTEEERELIKDLKSMDEIMPRPTPEQQKEFLEKVRNEGNEEPDEATDEDAIEKEFQVD